MHAKANTIEMKASTEGVFSIHDYHENGPPTQLQWRQLWPHTLLQGPPATSVFDRWRKFHLLRNGHWYKWDRRHHLSPIVHHKVEQSQALDTLIFHMRHYL